MNLFVAGWNLTDEQRRAVLAAFDETVAYYPQLDPSTRTSFQAGRTAVDCVSHGTSAVAPRRYARVTDTEAVVWDGCAYDRRSRVALHDAHALAEHWTELPDAIEGQFAAVRASASRLELVTDPLGLAPVFAAQLGDGWVVATSARLLARATGTRPDDDEAALLYMTLGWTPGDRTWHRAVRVVPGGQVWSWSGDTRAPARSTYFSARAVARRAARARSRIAIEELAAELEVGLRSLDHRFGPLVASLSGGRDSRVALALLLHAGIDASYYTLGVDESADVDIAREVAAGLGLTHSVVVLHDDDVLLRWHDLALHLATQTDGAVALREIIRLALRPRSVDRLGVEIWGAAGGIAKGNWMNRRLFLTRNPRDELVDSMYGRISSTYAGLVTPDADRAGRAFVAGYVDGAIADGVAPLDVPALFSVEERTRRWDYGNARLHTPGHDIFSPFATRDWVQAALSVSALRRFSSPYHHDLSARLVPALHDIRYDQPWRNQTPGLNLVADLRPFRSRRPDARDADAPSAAVGDWRRPDRFAWFEAKRDALRTLCLDQAGAPVWSAVDRSLFERVMAADADPAERRRRVTGLLYFATPCYYDSTFR